MPKLFYTLSLNLLFIFSSWAQIQSPSEYLQYELGSSFTPHHKIIDYIAHVNENLSSQSKIVQYGLTNEKRPLEVIFLGTEEQITNLENLRKNQKALRNGTRAVSSEDPAIVWLSYNVHGNEASGSEAFLKVLYDIASDPEKYLSGDLLYILDPCINPDGRDRYTSWYNRMAGKNINTDPASREHKEPWPNGRTNHYGFDLNRDWLWKTQVESQQRMKLFEQWLPHIHADFHEMGAEDTYFFPPAAKPFHRDITAWQRQFQEILGNTIKKPFDKNNWDFFTRETYDLLYPSYGDTYPIFNGTIGMTLEQGGSSRAGLSYIQETGDTLTLVDRLTHHHSVSLSIIEAAKTHSIRLKEEHAAFFENARKNGVGPYKNYIFKSKNEDKLNDLKEFLYQNHIEFEYIAATKNIKGFNFFTKKEEELTANKGDLIIGTKQSKGLLASVLLEPTTYLEDSNTYDITAWALPYLFDIQAYATNDNINTKPSFPEIASVPTIPKEKAYAYLAKWNHINDAELLGQLFQMNATIKVQSSKIQIGKEVFEPGTVIIQVNENQFAPLAKLAKSHRATLKPLLSGMVDKGPDLGSPYTRTLEKPKVALLTGEGTSVTSIADVWHFFDQTINYPISLIDTRYVSKIDFSEYTTLILANGSYSKLSITLEEVGNWVSEGGNLILIEDAIKWVEGSKHFKIKKKKVYDTKDQKLSYKQRKAERTSNQVVGAIFKTQLDYNHPLAYGYDEDSYFLLNHKPRYQLLVDDWNVGYLNESSYMSGLVGKKALENLNESLIFGVEQKGDGNVIYMQTNPLFRSFWQAGKLLFANAVFMVD